MHQSQAHGLAMDLTITFLVIWLSVDLIKAESNTSTIQPEVSVTTIIAESKQQALTVQYSLDASFLIADSISDAANHSKSLNLSTTKSLNEDAGLTELATTIATTSQPPLTTLPPTTTTSIGQSQTRRHTTPSYAQQPFCTLGDDTFQVGERWNPNLPPFGVQVCVLCECTIRPRKNCYEPKVTCRRITNECPVIDSCPDGKKPVTVTGQCCKSCQSTNLSLGQQDGHQTMITQSPSYESHLAKTSGDQHHVQTPIKIVYMNERIKDYMSLIKNLQACQNKDSETRPALTSSLPTIPSPAATHTLASKIPKGGRNDLNGIDTKLAFKSLHDSAPSYLSSPKNRQDESIKRLDHPSSEDSHQHPNDVQSASSSNSNNIVQQHQASNYGRLTPNNVDSQFPQQKQSIHCTLGNDTFQVGDIWNPTLPPFGIQVCVQCNCIYRMRKVCFETKVTCRRINKDCPVIESCPDGKPPVTITGQCCKSCPNRMNNIEQQSMNLMSSGNPTYMSIDGIQKNERVLKDFQTISKSHGLCVKTHDSVDIYNTNRYARRSQRA